MMRTLRTGSKRFANYYRPYLTFTDKLKQEEHKKFPDKKRNRLDYKDNFTAAIELPYSKTKIESLKNNSNELLTLSKTNIIEHANRRVDLFFYTLLAYYKTNLFPVLGHTYLQHGKGRSNQQDQTITQACHSSLTPSLIDETIFLPSLNTKKYRGLLDGTHLMDSLNSTVELPPFVNDLDDEIENTYFARQKSLEILHQVSAGKINPIQGLQEFLLLLREIFLKLESTLPENNHSLLVQHSLLHHAPVNKTLLQFIKEGTLEKTFSEENLGVKDSYVQLLLRLTPQEKELCEKSEIDKDKIYLEKMDDMQGEIMHAKSELRCR